MRKSEVFDPKLKVLMDLIDLKPSRSQPPSSPSDASSMVPSAPGSSIPTFPDFSGLDDDDVIPTEGMEEKIMRSC